MATFQLLEISAHHNIREDGSSLVLGFLSHEILFCWFTFISHKFFLIHRKVDGALHQPKGVIFAQFTCKILVRLNKKSPSRFFSGNHVERPSGLPHQGTTIFAVGPRPMRLLTTLSCEYFVQGYGYF